MAKAIPRFIDMFNTPDQPVEISGGEHNERIVFNSENYNCKYAWIKGATFHDWVEFEQVKLGAGIKFQNCRFLKGISFKNCSAEGREVEFNPDSYSLYFIDCEVESIELPIINTFERGIFLSGGGIGKLFMSDLQVSKGSLRMEGVTVAYEFKLSNCILEDKAGQFTIARSIVRASVRYENLFAGGGLSFLHTTFEKDVYVWAGEVGSVVFNDGLFNDDFTLEGIRINDGLSLSGTTFEKSVKVMLDAYEHEGYCKQLYVTNTKCKRPMDIIGSGEPIADLAIVASSNFEGTYRFANCIILQTIIDGDNQNANIRFSDCDFKKLFFSNFTNTSTLAFTSCKAFDADSVFESDNTNFGKMELFNFLFSSFKSVTIADCLISEIVTTGVDWFEDKKLEVADNGRPHRNRRELYRQLKQVCDRQGDRIQALEFQALELIAFRKEIKETKGWWNKDRWILRLSVTNDFGLHWGKPLVWITVLSLFLFYPLIVTSASPKLLASPAKSLKDIEVTWNELVHYGDVLPQLFNPARLTFRLFPEIERLGFWTHFWDGCQRIVLAFFIVQIVAAFRKYVRN